MADWWEDILKNAGNNIVTGVTNAASNPQLIPALASAYHFYNQADKYGNMGNQLGKDANPFGDRQMYRQGLDNLYANPDSIANTAAYKFKRDQGLGILGPQLAAKGGGFGNTERALIDYASGLASTEYDKEWQRLYEAAGGKFDPANAGKLRLDAAGLEANAKGAALDALFTPFKPGSNTTINNTGPGGGIGNPGSLGKSIWDETTGNLGATGKWISDGANMGKYMLKDGTVIDVTKLSEAARAGDQEAIQWLTRISGGATVDEQIRNLGTYDGGLTGDPYNPDGGAGLTPADPYYTGPGYETPISAPDPSYWENVVIPTADSWYDWGGQ